MPLILPANTASYINAGDAGLVAIRCAPSGFVALLEVTDWKALQDWKLNRLRISRGRVRACGVGRPAGFDAARFLLRAKRDHIVFYKNGNPLDLRRRNIVSVPRKLLQQAEIERARPADYHSVDFKMRDGRWRTRRKPKTPSAVDRVADLLRPTAP